MELVSVCDHRQQAGEMGGDGPGSDLLTTSPGRHARSCSMAKLRCPTIAVSRISTTGRTPWPGAGPVRARKATRLARPRVGARKPVTRNSLLRGPRVRIHLSPAVSHVRTRFFSNLFARKRRVAAGGNLR